MELHNTQITFSKLGATTEEIKALETVDAILDNAFEMIVDNCDGAGSIAFNDEAEAVSDYSRDSVSEDDLEFAQGVIQTLLDMIRAKKGLRFKD